MNISLTPALEKFVNDKVASGLYNSVSEVIREAIRLLISKEAISQEQIMKLNRDIEEGLDDTVSYDGQEALSRLKSDYAK